MRAGLFELRINLKAGKLQRNRKAAVRIRIFLIFFLLSEIRRLEEQLEQALAVEQSSREALEKCLEEFTANQLKLVKAEGSLHLLEEQAQNLRAENEKLHKELTAWVERATTAEKAQEKLRGENQHLNQELSEVSTRSRTLADRLEQREDELQAARVELAKKVSAVELLQDEAKRMRAENEKSQKELTGWVERATNAEARLRLPEREKKPRK